MMIKAAALGAAKGSVRGFLWGTVLVLAVSIVLYWIFSQ